MLRLSSMIRIVSSIQVDLAALAAVLILLQVTVDLVLRYFFSSPITSSTEIVAYYYLVPLVFLPMLSVEYYDHHITTDLFFLRFPKKMQETCLLLGSILSIALYAVLAWYSLSAAIDATEKQEVVIGAELLPIWPMRWILPIAFITAAVGALARAIDILINGPRTENLSDPKDIDYE